MTAIKCIDLCKFFQQGDVVIKALDHVSLSSSRRWTTSRSILKKARSSVFPAHPALEKPLC